MKDESEAGAAIVTGASRGIGRGMSQGKRIAVVMGEHVLFFIALVLLVPPIPSEKGQVYDYFPTAPFIAVAAAGSRWCAWVAGRESWAGLIMKTGMFVAVGYVMNLRTRY
ncbi:MAG: hypothetical protein JWN40_4586 [Phycisphaerales bacterium]|nr:hypothetical protein [Phycisphaerales bacterium]